MSSKAIYPLTPEQKYQRQLEYNRQWRAANREKYLAAKAAKRATTPPEERSQKYKESYQRNKEHRKAYANAAYQEKKEQLREYRQRTIEMSMVRSARQRAKRQGVPCTITAADIIIPDTCPILGIPLIMAEGMANDNSPSLDKIIPALGYVPGNIQVISNRANRIKYNATLEELRLVAAHLEQILSR